MTSPTICTLGGGSKSGTSGFSVFSLTGTNSDDSESVETLFCLRRSLAGTTFNTCTLAGGGKSIGSSNLSFEMLDSSVVAASGLLVVFSFSKPKLVLNTRAFSLVESLSRGGSDKSLEFRSEHSCPRETAITAFSLVESLLGSSSGTGSGWGKMAVEDFSNTLDLGGFIILAEEGSGEVIGYSSKDFS